MSWEKYSQWNSHLIGHQRIHIGENLCKCNQCGKSLDGDFYLIVNQKIHIQVEKPHECNMKTPSADHLSYGHQRIHSERSLLHTICIQSVQKCFHLVPFPCCISENSSLKKTINSFQCNDIRSISAPLLLQDSLKDNPTKGDQLDSVLSTTEAQI